MIRARLLLSALAALLAAGCATSGPRVEPPATPPPRADRPTYAVGDKWIRNDGVWDLIRVEEDTYVFASDQGREIRLTRDLVPFLWGRNRTTEWWFFAFHSYTTGEYWGPRLTWPLQVGKTGTGAGLWGFFSWQAPPWARLRPDRPRGFGEGMRPYWTPPREYSATAIPAKFTWTVEAYEEVRTPAGTFNAFRIYHEITEITAFSEGSPRRWWLRTWYAPEVQQLVKAEGRNAGLFAFEVVAIDQPLREPFRVGLDEPKDQSRLASDELTVTGRVTARIGVSRVTVTLNGQEVFRRDEPAPTPEVGLKVPVRLREGRNVLLVTATDAMGESRQEARTVVYDVELARSAADTLRQEMLKAREGAAHEDAERLVPTLWAAAQAKEREAEAALGREEFGRTGTAYGEAREAYQQAEREARWTAQARSARGQAVEARRAAEVAGAPNLAPEIWSRATQIMEKAEATLERDEFYQAVFLLRQAKEEYHAAEREATQKAAAAAQAERQRLAALRQSLEAAQRVAAATTTARREAEQAGAPRHAPQLFAGGEQQERQGQAALDRQEFAAAEQRLRDAEAGYRRAVQEAQRAAEAERREAPVRAQQQRQAEQLRDETARARRQAEEAEARRWVPPLWAAAATKEADAQTALGRRDYAGAQLRFREAREAYEQSATEARRTAQAALPPLQVALATPRDQALVEQETLALAGVVRSGRGVRRVVVTLDGIEIGRLDEPTPPPSLAVNLPVRLREGQNTLVLTATEADGAIHQEVRTVHFAKPTPLTLAVRYPEERARFTDESTVVAAVIESSKGVARVTVTLNGTEVHRQAERAPRKSLAVAIPLTLRPGANAIVLAAAEPDGTVRQEVRTVTYDRPKDADAPPPPARPAPERWAVVIGVGRYESPGVPRLRYTVPDAEAVYETLVGPGGFKRENVLLLTDTSDRKPTLRHIKWALGTFLARSARKDDTVLIFFAGHGAPEIDPRGVEADGLAKYLVPTDADPDDLFSTALPMDDIETIFRRIEAERVVAFLDTCYSGAAGGRTFASKRTRASRLDDEFLVRLARARGRAIITAARPSEVAVELPELGHGLFTYYLVQGLRGAADLNRDGIVALQELYEYLEREVTQRSRAVGANQHPVLKGELEGSLPLVKVRP